MSLAPMLRGESDVPEDRILIISYSRMPFSCDFPSPYSQSTLTRNWSAVL